MAIVGYKVFGSAGPNTVPITWTIAPLMSIPPPAPVVIGTTFTSQIIQNQFGLTHFELACVRIGSILGNIVRFRIFDVSATSGAGVTDDRIVPPNFTMFETVLAPVTNTIGWRVYSRINAGGGNFFDYVIPFYAFKVSIDFNIIGLSDWFQSTLYLTGV